MKRAAMLSAFLITGLLLNGSPAQSDTTLRLTVNPQGSPSRGGPMGKVGTLARLHAEYAATVAKGSQAAFKPSNSLIRVNKAGFVLIDAVAANDAATLQADLEALGLQRAARFGRRVSGWFPMRALDKMAPLRSLKFAHPSYALTQAGLVTSQGDQAMRSNIARGSGVDGTGVTVGVLSDSYNCLGGAAADIANGDLPSQVTVRDDLNFIECPPWGPMKVEP